VEPVHYFNFQSRCSKKPRWHQVPDGQDLSDSMPAVHEFMRSCLHYLVAQTVAKLTGFSAACCRCADEARWFQITLHNLSCAFHVETGIRKTRSSCSNVQSRFSLTKLFLGVRMCMCCRNPAQQGCSAPYFTTSHTFNHHHLNHIDSL
jgi:hypothetical protein